ncbi:alpha/beta fold hydrolase [Nocardioides humi]|uniref:Alpha/beta fold hydrolase n=1 Tax=Nocardioides humi TaxID=449461 RepID=A0ABN2BT31_9ACTN|nr:alpha/beta hydrolase [Nocardioides humi]
MTLTEEGIVHVPGMASRWVRLASGAKAHYMTSGDTGPAVVLLHGGLPGSSGTAGWRHMAPFLGANGFRVYCPDQPAFGLSDTREEYWPAGIESHVDFLHEFTTALCLDRFHLAGNSMGGINTVNYVCAHPERVASFVIIAADVGDVAPGNRPEGAVPLPKIDGNAESMRAGMTAITSGTMSEELIQMRAEAAARHDQAFKAFFPSMWDYAFLQLTGDRAARLATKGRLDRVEAPGICLYGQDDVLQPVEWGYHQEDHLPRIQFFYPADCGHQGQSDQPELFNQVFLEFFRDGRVSGATADAAGVSRRRPELSDLVARP